MSFLTQIERQVQARVDQLSRTMERTHDLLSGDFAAALHALVDALGADVDDAVVRVDRDELESPPDGETCRHTWERSVDQFERLPEADEGGRTGWRCDPTDEAAWKSFRDVVGLAENATGAYFVYRVTLLREEQDVFDAVPHHSSAGLNADLLGETTVGEANAALEDVAGCLVPSQPVVEWTADDRRWSVGGGSLCVERVDGPTSKCYEVTNLRRIRVTDDGTALDLRWAAEGFPDDLIGRTLSWAAGKLYSPPEMIPCESTARAAEVQAVLRETLERFDGRQV